MAGPSARMHLRPLSILRVCGACTGRTIDRSGQMARFAVNLSRPQNSATQAVRLALGSAASGVRPVSRTSGCGWARLAVRLGDVGLDGLEQDGVRGRVGQVQAHAGGRGRQRAAQRLAHARRHLRQPLRRRKCLPARRSARVSFDVSVTPLRTGPSLRACCRSAARHRRGARAPSRSRTWFACASAPGLQQACHTHSARRRAPARACSRSGRPAAAPGADAATRTAVTLVMNDSIGSTASLVAAMMNASHVALSSFSSSFLLSTCAPRRRTLTPPCPALATGGAACAPGMPAAMRWLAVHMRARQRVLPAPGSSRRSRLQRAGHAR